MDLIKSPLINAQIDCRSGNTRARKRDKSQDILSYKFTKLKREIEYNVTTLTLILFSLASVYIDCCCGRVSVLGGNSENYIILIINYLVKAMHIFHQLQKINYI